MESKTKHRIIGAFVIIGLVILLLPFFQMNKDLNKKTTIAKAPPFPIPSTQVAANTDLREAELMPVMEDKNLDNQEEALPIIDAMEHKEDVKVAPKEQQVSQKIIPEETSKQIDNALNSPTEITAKLVNNKTLAPTKLKIKENNSYDFNHSAWVIQIGSFSDKANALRLVNRLRASGYQAFMQEVKTLVGSSTRVFVGPEKQRASARTLANKLESNLKIHGVVMSYKPLAI